MRWCTLFTYLLTQFARGV